MAEDIPVLSELPRDNKVKGGEIPILEPLKPEKKKNIPSASLAGPSPSVGLSEHEPDGPVFPAGYEQRFQKVDVNEVKRLLGVQAQKPDIPAWQAEKFATVEKNMREAEKSFNKPLPPENPAVREYIEELSNYPPEVQQRVFPTMTEQDIPQLNKLRDDYQFKREKEQERFTVLNTQIPVVDAIVNAFDKGVVGGVASAMDFMDGANKMFNDAIGTALGIESPETTLFSEAAKYLRSRDSEWDLKPVLGSKSLTESVKGLGEVVPMMATLALMPELKVAGAFIPSFPTYMGSTAALSAYGGARGAGAPVTDALDESIKAALPATLTGALFHEFGYQSGMLGMAALESGVGSMGATATSVLGNASGFVSVGDIMTELQGGKYDSEDVQRDAILGVLLGGKAFGESAKGEVAKFIMRRAYQNYFSVDPYKMSGMSRAEILENVPKAREEAIKLRDRAAEETDKVKKNQLIIAAGTIDAIADITVVGNIVANNASSVKEMIQADPNLAPEIKARWVDHIDKTVAANDPKTDKARALGTEAMKIQRSIDDITGNSQIPEEAKKAMTAPLEEKLNGVNQSIKDLFDPTKQQAVEVIQADKGKVTAPKTGDEYESSLVDVFGYTPEVAKAHRALADMAAEQWASETGGKAQDWFKDTFSGIQNEAAYKAQKVDQMIKDGATPEKAEEAVTKEIKEENRRAIVRFNKEGKAIVTAFKGADSSTAAHEALGHTYFERRIREAKIGNEKAKSILESVIGEYNRETKSSLTFDDLIASSEAKDKTVYTDLHEKFATGFEHYLKEGGAGISGSKKKVFDDFKNWITQVYTGLDESGIKPSKGMTDLYNEMLNIKDEGGQNAVQKRSAEEEVPSAGKTGQDKQKGPAGVEPGKQGVEPAAKIKEKELTNISRTAKKVAKSNESYKLLDSDPGLSGSTWTAGGCLAFAKAAQKAFGGDLVTIKNDKGEVQHVMVQLGDKYLDADGLEPIDKKIDRSENEELVDNPVLSDFSEKEIKKSGIGEPRQETIDALSDMLQGKSLSGKTEKIIASVKGSNIKLSLPAEVAGKVPHKVFGSEQKAKDYKQRVVDAYIRNNPGEVLSSFDQPGKKKVSEIGFYSNVEDALGKITQEKGTPEQFKAMLLKNGAKQAEMDWMDFDSQFANQKSITKGDVQEWIEQNRIDINEVTKGASEWVGDELYEGGEILADIFQDNIGKWHYRTDFEEESRAFKTREAAMVEAEADVAVLGYHSDNMTRYSKYQIPGGSGYKEILLTAPVESKWKIQKDKYGIWIADGGYNGSEHIEGETRGDVERQIKEYDRIKRNNSNDNSFHSAHFDEPNILAHVRFNERTDSNGERVLFIEEVQSDWAQQGKKEGFKDSEETKKEKLLYDLGGDWHAVTKGYGVWADATIEQKQNELNRIKTRLEINGLTENDFAESLTKWGDRTQMPSYGLPNMPFKKTDQWVNLALRRMVRYAAENGFDRIAWTTGEQQADRYDLSKQVKSVRVEPSASNTGEYRLTVWGNNDRIIVPSDGYGALRVTSEELPNYIGKELADKAVKDINKSNDRVEYSGLDLKVGGEAMSVFYDKIIPKNANNLAKQFGSGVERVEIDNVGEVNSIPITSQMSETVLGEGVPLFQRAKQLRDKAENIAEREKAEIHTTPRGYKQTSPHRTYMDATQSKGFDSGKNVWVRDSKDESNSDRVLMVQISNSVINPVREGILDKLYDRLYDIRPGYDRPDDFFEIPLWSTVGRHNLGDKGDMYAVRDMDEAKKFIAESGYKGIAMSALDVNKEFIRDLAKDNPNTKFLVGGYVDPSYFAEQKNVEWANDFSAISKLSGKPYQPGFSYDIFADTKTMPRLKMSEGCRNKCAFCSIPKKIIEVPKEVIDQQVNDILRLDATLGYVDDKTFGEASNWKYLQQVYNRIKAVKENFIGFVVQTTAPQLLKFNPQDLKDAGIKYVELGIETFNDPILKALHKPTTEKISQKATDYLRDNKIALIPNIIVGLRAKNAKGEWIEEDATTYARTMEYLEKNKDVISHPNIYSLSMYEGTELNADINSQVEADRNELEIEKSFHNNKGVHEKAYNQFVEWGRKALEEVPFEDKENYLELSQGGKKTNLQAKRAAVAQTIPDRLGKMEEEYFGTKTPTAAEIKAKSDKGPMAKFNHVVGFPTKLQTQHLGRVVDRFGDKVADWVGRALSSKSGAVRSAFRTIDGFSANIGKTVDQINHADAMRGGMNEGIHHASKIAEQLYGLIDNNVHSLERIDRALDPEFYAKKTLDEYKAYLEKTLKPDDFRSLKENEIETMYNELKTASGWDDPNYIDVTPQDLSVTEFAVYNGIKKIYDLVHDVNFSIGKLSNETYEAHKGTYSPRLYGETEMPADVTTQAEKIMSAMEIGMYKRRGAVDDWRVQHKLADPVLGMSKRLSQTMANLAIHDYATYLVDNPKDVISEAEKVGYTKMGRGYGPLEDKWLRNDIAESFKGVMFTNHMWDRFHKAFTTYSNNPARRILKAGVTVYRPDVNIGNITGNIVFASLVGANPGRYLTNLLFHTASEFKGYGENLRFLQRKGLIDSAVTMDDLRRASVVVDQLVRGQVNEGALPKWLDNADATVKKFYQGVDQYAKVAAFKSLVQAGVDPDMAAFRVAEGFQNFSRVGRIYDFASKTPIIGPPFAKFAGDLVRITKSAALRNPLQLAIFAAGLSMIESNLSNFYGETDEDRRVRITRRGIPKMGPIPLEWKMGNKVINVARFVSPLYGYTLDESDDFWGMFTRLAPYPVPIKKNIEKSDLVRFMSSDILTAPIMDLWADMDWSGVPISDPKKEKWSKDSNLPEREQKVNKLRFLAKSYIPGYGAMLDDMLYVDKHGEDRYGRKRTVSMVFMRYLGYNVQIFDDAKYQQVIEKSLKNDMFELTDNIRQLRHIENVYKGNVKDEKLTKEQYDKKQEEILTKRIDILDRAKKKAQENVRRVPAKRLAEIITDFNYQSELYRMFGVQPEMTSEGAVADPGSAVSAGFEGPVK